MIENDPIYSDIHHRGFELALRDTRMLRGMYRRINPDITYVSLNKLPKKFLIDKILIDEFTARVMAEYRKHCEMLDKFERIANGFVLTEINKSSEEGECNEDTF